MWCLEYNRSSKLAVSIGWVGSRKKQEEENGFDKIKEHLAGGEPCVITKPTHQRSPFMVKIAAKHFGCPSTTSLVDFPCKIQLFLVFSPIKELQASTLVWQRAETMEIIEVFWSFNFL